MTNKQIEKIIIEKVAFIAVGIVDIMMVLIMICLCVTPEVNFTLGHFITSMLSLIGYNYIVLRIAKEIGVK